MARLVIFGTGGLAEMAHFYFTNDSDHEIVAFTVHEEHMPKDRVYMGFPVVPFEEVTESHPPDTHSMFVAIGYRKVNKLRAAVYEEAKGKGYELVTYISSKATYFGKEIGDNCFIFEDNTIQPYVKIGNNVVMWSGNHIGHWVEIADHVFISSQVTISGYTKIGAYTFLGVNSTFRDVTTVGESNVIGAGAIIMRDTEDNEVYIPERTKPFPKKSDEINF